MNERPSPNRTLPWHAGATIGPGAPGISARVQATRRDLRRRGFVKEQLATVPLFAACSKREVGLISQLSTGVSVPAGEKLTQEGKLGREFRATKAEQDPLNLMNMTLTIMTG